MTALLEDFTFVSVLIRLLLAMAAGGLIGLDREAKGRPAGFRTYMLTSLGAALTMVFSIYEFYMIAGPWADLAKEVGIRIDISRFSAQVINGIGFLGAGTILVRKNHRIKGLTTASGLFASACMGIAAGAGFLACVLIALPLIFLSMRVFPAVDDRIRESTKEMNLYVQLDHVTHVSQVIDLLKSREILILEIDIEKGKPDKMILPSVIFHLRLKARGMHAELISQVAKLDCIQRIEEI